MLTEQRLRALSRALLPEAMFVSVLPGPVLGPPVGGTRVAASIDKTLAPLLTGKLRAGSVDLWLGLVDVRDVAEVCLQALCVDPDRLRCLGDTGRFVSVAQPVAHLQDLADTLRAAFPSELCVGVRGAARHPRAAASSKGCSVHRRGARPRCWTGATRWSTYPPQTCVPEALAA